MRKRQYVEDVEDNEDGEEEEDYLSYVATTHPHWTVVPGEVAQTARRHLCHTHLQRTQRFNGDDDSGADNNTI